MKLKKVLILAFMLITSPAWAGTYWFTTIEQAEKNCPAVTGLNYTAKTQGLGTVMGNSPNGRSFTSYNTTTKTHLVMRPENISVNQDSGPVADALFRNSGLGYGYINTDINEITCLYGYPGWTGVSVALVMVSG